MGILQADGGRTASASSRFTAGVALVLTLVWVGACVPWASAPDVLQEGAVSQKFEQPQKGALTSAQRKIQQEYGKLAALNTWNRPSNQAVVDSLKDHVHSQARSIAQLGSDAGDGASKAQTLFDDFSSPHESPHQFFKAAKPSTSFKAELKSLAKQQKHSQAEVSSADHHPRLAFRRRLAKHAAGACSALTRALDRWTRLYTRSRRSWNP